MKELEKEKFLEEVRAKQSPNLSERCPHLFSSFRQHYRRMRKRGAMWVGCGDGMYVSDSSEAAFNNFLSGFTDEDRKAIKKDIDNRPTPSHASVTKTIARLLEGMDDESVKRLMEDMT